MHGQRHILDAIGNTPLVELRRIVPDSSARIVAKLESANPTGSMKDRLARTIIERAATAGTTGISLALVASAQGYRTHFVFSDAFSDEKRWTMRAYGAEITDVVSDSKRITKELIQAMIARAGEISRQPGHWWADQLNNEDGADGYAGLGEEIWSQTDGQVDALVHTVSTAHSIHGMSRALRRPKPDLPVFAVEPAESAVLSGKPPGSHKIEGIGLGFIPPLWHPEEVNEILTVSTDDAKAMARRLAREEAIFAGTSTERTSLPRFGSRSGSAPGKRSQRSSSIQACATSARTFSAAECRPHAAACGKASSRRNSCRQSRKKSAGGSGGPVSLAEQTVSYWAGAGSGAGAGTIPPPWAGESACSCSARSYGRA